MKRTKKQKGPLSKKTKTEIDISTIFLNIKLIFFICKFSVLAEELNQLKLNYIMCCKSDRPSDLFSKNYIVD